jgi:hypothetical protein
VSPCERFCGVHARPVTVVLYVEALYTQRRSSTAISPDTEAALEVPEIQSRHAGSLSAFPALEGSGRQVPASLPA